MLQVTNYEPQSTMFKRLARLLVGMLEPVTGQALERLVPQGSTIVQQSFDGSGSGIQHQLSIAQWAPEERHG